jgi:glycosyltransferase involved in cell wall biosynthesis
MEHVTFQARERLLIFLKHIDRPSKSSSTDTEFRNLSSMIECLMGLNSSNKDWNALESWALVYYVLSGSLPVRDDLISLRWGYQQSGTSGAGEAYEKLQKEFVEDSKISFVNLEPDSICIDISHTINYPFNTGIQRVIRQLGTNLLTNPRVNWVVWNENHQVWQLVDKNIVSEKLPFRHNAESSSVEKKNGRIAKVLIAAFWHGLFSSYRYLISNSGREQALQTSLLTRSIKFFRGKHLNNSTGGNYLSESIHVPLLYNQTLLIVEPIQGERIVNRLLYFGSIGNLSVLVYDLLPISNPEFFAASSIQSFPNYLNLLSKASNIVTISDFTLNQVQKFADVNPDINMKSIHLPIGFKELLEDKSKSGVVPKFLCVGSIEPRKNHLSILRAAEHCWEKGHKFQLVFVGGQGWNNASIIDYCKDLKTKNRDLKIINDASDSALLELYCEASAYISVPWVEGFGLPLAEAMSTGKPVIASDISSHREFGDKRNVFFVKPDDVRGIANLMSGLLSTQTDVELEGTGQQESYSWAEYSEELLRAITK